MRNPQGVCRAIHRTGPCPAAEHAANPVGLFGRPTGHVGGMKELRVSLIVAVAENGIIGAGDDLPWRVAADMRHFNLDNFDVHFVKGKGLRNQGSNI